MDGNIVVALIAFAGTVAGSFGGVWATSKLTNFRLEKLEQKVDRHNQVVERTYILEEQVRVANHRIEDLERHEEKGRN